MACEIYQLAPQTHTQMMGYVIRTGAGELFVVDGGTAGESAYLLHLLRRLGGERPRVRGWFLTHPHSDHMDAFLTLMQQSEGAVLVDAVYAHMPRRQLLEAGEMGALKTWDWYARLRPGFAEKEHVLQEGETLLLGDTAWEVLYTSDPAFVNNAANNSSCVLRLKAAGVRVLFLGDLGAEGGEKLLSLHGSALKSDIVQMAHHGQSAVRMDVYETVRPQMCLWCAPKWLWENNAGSCGYDSGPWDIFHTRAEMARLRVRHHAVAKDGTFCLTLENGAFTYAVCDPFAAQ